MSTWERKRNEERMRGQERLWCGIMKDRRENQGEFLEKGEANSLTQLKSPRPNVHTEWKQQPFRNMFSHPQEFFSGIFHSSEAGLFLWGFGNRKLSAVKQGGDLKTYNAITTRPFLSSVYELESKREWVCDTVCVWADVCIKTNKKKHKGKHSSVIAKAWRSLHWEGRQWLQCLTTELLSGHKGPLVPPLSIHGGLPWMGICVLGRAQGSGRNEGKSPKPSAPITMAFKRSLTCFSLTTVGKYT